MPKSPYATKLDEILKQVTQFLKPLGFKKKARTYNRTTDDGIIHVIGFQMGQYPLGYVVPGIRDNLYGKFTVNMGVFLRCVNKAEKRTPQPDFVTAWNCTIQARLGQVINGRDRWFEVGEDNEKVSKTLVQLLDRHGLPFLDQFPDYTTILTQLEKGKKIVNVQVLSSNLIAAIVAHHLGKEKKSKELLKKAYATGKGGWEHVAQVAKRLGIKVT